MDDKKILTEEELDQVAGGQNEGMFCMYKCINEYPTGSGKQCLKYFISNYPDGPCPECKDTVNRILVTDFQS